ncbi:Longitudinals lacking protein, isoforms A/B/D/L [Frankliniella fusca]|uniref:Longitudinals lacking protein, isoforms A/B/D/L n=1 Tax=Frankliniella fusca TaxID=407009 RepID=A0AAE1H6H1_9NEOP|nr:Longitudinals lacking protein, isoforms A/B/D/L [Frankliniella fusca]
MFTPFHCKECGKQYRHKRSLASHQRFECGKSAQFQCPMCPQRATIHSTMTRVASVEIHWIPPVATEMAWDRPQANRRFKCERCGNTFANRSNLNKHLRYTCGQEPQFPCPVCPYRSKQKSHLLLHVANRHPGCDVAVLRTMPPRQWDIQKNLYG